MNIEVNRIEHAFSFQIAGEDLGILVADLLKAECDPRSPLSRLAKKLRAGKRPRASKELRTLAKDESVARAIAILAAPELVMANRTGGASLPISFFTACHAPTVDADEFVVLTPSFQGAFLIQVFETRWLFLAWWLSQNAALVNEPAANMIPPPVGYESLIYMLHAVDLFRRKAMESQLQFEPSTTPFLPADEFGKTLKESVMSHDLRWLVPAFLGLTPGLDQFKFSDGANHLEALSRHDFLLPAKSKNKTAQNRLVFGAAGRAMGAEFYHTWFQAVGFETLVRGSVEWVAAHRGFLAPTGLANHLILINAGDGRSDANHQAMTRDALDRKMSDLLDEAVGAATSTAARPQEPAAKTQLRCVSCDEPLLATHKFCPACATPVKPLPDGEPQKAAAPNAAKSSRTKPDAGTSDAGAKFCAKCGHKLKPGAKFCSKCGHRI